HLAIKELQTWKQPVTGYRHDAKVWKDIGKIASPDCQHYDCKDEPAKCEWFYQVTSAIGDNGHPRRHLRDDGGVAGEPAQKVFLGPMHFDRFDPAKHLLCVAVRSAESSPKTFVNLLAFPRKETKNSEIKRAEPQCSEESDDGLDEKKRDEQECRGYSTRYAIQQWKQNSAGVIPHVAHYFSKQVAGIALEEIAVRRRSPSTQEPDAEPVTETHR